MVLEETKKREELARLLRLTHPKTIEAVKKELEHADNPKKKEFLEWVLEEAKRRDEIIEEYTNLTKLFAMMRGEEDINEKSLKELIEEMDGLRLLEKELNDRS